MTFSQPLTLILPIRRALTPGENIAVFGMTEGSEWSILSDGVDETVDGETAAAIVVRDGLDVELSLNASTFGSTPYIIAVGIDSAKRSVSTSSGVGRAGDDAPYF